MSFLFTAPEVVSAAAGDLADIGSTLREATAAASGPTTTFAVAAGDEVSLAVSRLFGGYGEQFAALSAQAAAFHHEFVSLLSHAATAYLSTEAGAEQALLSATIAPAAATPAATLPLLGGLTGILGGVSPILGGGGGIFGGLSPILGGFEALLTGGNLAPYIGVPSYLDPILGPVSQLLFTGGPVGPIIAGSPLGPTLRGIGLDLGGVLSTLISGGVPTVLSNPFGLLGQALSGAIVDVPLLHGLQPVLAPLFPNLFEASQTATAAGNPWQMLIANTEANLHSLNSTWAAHPFPLLHQVIANQQGYAQAFGGGLALTLENFPTTLANVPENIQISLQGAATFNPGALAQAFVNQQVGYAQTFSAALSKAGADLQTTLPTFQADLALASQAISAGNYNAAVVDVTQGALGLFISGFNTSNLTNILVLGPGGDLLPILGIPALQAQNFAALLPPGSILAQMAHNYTSAVTTLTNATISTSIQVGVNPLVTVGANFGLPLSLAFSVLGAPVAGFGGFATGAQVLGAALASGNGVAAAGALVDLPAYALNGFLNGETVIGLSMPATVGGVTVPLTMSLPFDGILVAPHAISATVDLSILGLATIPVTVPVGGTPFGGLLPALVDYLPEQLAAAITP
ncbi:PE domain-containing protein [Mycobacterium parmense]|uniref:Uncharacterized protein n=1 Tax=Mycobacterium parmense TaxID=185642 RepID=A0A7I7YT42_9MYCO|nr:PE domain-containing protein [Mycobacterium parmense]ORW56955.1 hypothetical protein AWC20_14830 [Mycobacterium parmense]BBZ43911.1 hypothetical protein MPRM_11920 [Mycobacterium parmense]